MGATVVESAAADRLLTEEVALVDRSERGKLALTGPQAKELLSGQVTNDIEALGPGAGCYAALLTNKGKMVADLRVLDTADELWLDTERVALQALFDTLRRGAVGWDAELHKRTLQQALLSLVGPHAAQAAGAELGPEHANRHAQLGGAGVLLVATDAGIDVVCAAEDADRVRAALDVPAVPEAAAEVLRVESGRPRYGLDLDDATIPQEAGLNERAVSFTKGCYVGQETVARLHYKGKPNRHLRGLRLSAPVPSGTPLLLGEREVGRVGSSVVSPRFGPIALALVRREAGVGDELAAGPAVAVVAELPF
ncbi:MAG TPA: folate-binding protein [Solirubrobacteraceae bacterium]|nr:folate-binding protein [Solirubrobacteraceae bacterium]